jgi:RHS repeat-associated protein
MKILLVVVAAFSMWRVYGATYVSPVATVRIRDRVYSTTMAIRNDSQRDVSCDAIYSGPRIGGSETLRARYEIPAGKTVTTEDTLMEVSAIGTMRFVCSDEVLIATRIQTSSDDGLTFDVGRVFPAATDANDARVKTTFEAKTSTDLLVMEVAGKTGSFDVLVTDTDGAMLGESRYDLRPFGQQIVNLSSILEQTSEVRVQIRLSADGGGVVVAKATHDAALLKIARRMSPESRARFNAHRAGQASAASNKAAAPSVTEHLPIFPFKAAPFREPVTGLVYMRDRWYDPSTGTFLTPDRMGFADSSNPYSFTAADPVNKSDPTGMYQADIHYGMTYFLALRAGFCDDVARRIATGAEFPDQDPGRAPVTQFKIAANPRATSAQRDEAQNMLHQWHFPKPLRNAGIVVPGSQEAQAIIAEGLRRGNVWLFSQGIHPLQDSWSHRGQPSWKGVAGHPKARGGLTSTRTDQPWRWPLEAREASQATYNYLVAFRNMHPLSVGACGRKAAAWSQIEREVAAFIVLKSKANKSKWLAARGVTMPEYLWDDVEDE